MSTVFVVTFGEYSDTRIVATFSTREKAIGYIERCRQAVVTDNANDGDDGDRVRYSDEHQKPFAVSGLDAMYHDSTSTDVHEIEIDSPDIDAALTRIEQTLGLKRDEKESDQ